MRKFFPLLLLVIFSSFKISFATWTLVPTTINDNFNAIDSWSHIYIAGDKGIYHAVNSNINNIIRFQPSNPPDSIIYNRCRFSDIQRSTLNSSVFYFAGTDTVANTAVIFKIDHNNATSNVDYIGPANTNLNSICLADYGMIVAVGDNGFVLKKYNNNYSIETLNTSKDLKVVRYGALGTAPFDNLCIVADELAIFGRPAYGPTNFDTFLTHKPLPGIFPGAMDMAPFGNHALIFGDSATFVSRTSMFHHNNFKPKPLNAQGCYFNGAVWVLTDHGIYHGSTNFSSPNQSYLEFQPSSAGYNLKDYDQHGALTSFAVGTNGVILESTNAGKPNIPAAYINTDNSCLGQGLYLNGISGSGTNCTWYVNSNFVASNQCTQTTNSVPVGTYTIEYIVSNGTYSDTATKTVYVVDSPLINTPVSLLDSSVICKEGTRSVVLDSCVIGNTYKLYNSSGQNVIDQFTAHHIADTMHNVYFDLADSYVLQVTDTTGHCSVSFTDSVVMEVDETLARPFVSHSNAVSGDHVDFFSWSRDADSADWTFSNTASPSFSQQLHPENVTFSDTSLTNNRLIATSINGCKDTAFINQPMMVKEDLVPADCWINHLSGKDTAVANSYTANPRIVDVIKVDDALMVIGYQDNGAEISSQFGISSFSEKGKEGAFISKYTTQGTMKWTNYFYHTDCPTRTIGVRISSIVSVDSGDYLILGNYGQGSTLYCNTFPSSLYYVPSSGEPVSLSGKSFVIRIDSNGNFKWQAATDGYAGKMILDTVTQSVIFTVKSQDVLNYSKGTTNISCFPQGPALTQWPYSYQYLIKIDYNGNYKWSARLHTYQNNGTPGIKDMVMDKLGNINVTAAYETWVKIESANGDSLHVPRIPSTSQYGSLFYIAQFDSSGVYKWKIIGTGEPSSELYSQTIDVDDNNNIYFDTHYPHSGYSHIKFQQTNGTFLYPNLSKPYAFHKLTPTGGFIWHVGLSDSMHTRWIDVKDDSIYLSMGNVYNTTTPNHIYSRGGLDSLIVPAGYSNFFIAKFHSDGHAQSIYYDSLNPLTRAFPAKKIPLGGGKFYLGGYVGEINNNLISGLFGEMLPTVGHDGFLAKVDYDVCGNRIDNNVINKFAVDYVCKGDNYTFPDSSIAMNVLTDTIQKSTFTSVLYNMDSSITTSLKVIFPVYSVMYDSVCYGKSYTFPDSSVLSYATNYVSDTSVLVRSNNGCDSIVIVRLTVLQMDTTLTSIGFTLTANENSATYQWYDCDNNTIIAGATNQSYVVSANGSYAVIMNKNNCTDTSACYPITTIGIPEQSINSPIKILPNPNSGKFKIILDKSYEDIKVEIVDLTCRTVYSKKFNQLKEKTISFHGANGIYNLKLIINGKTNWVKLIKK